MTDAASDDHRFRIYRDADAREFHESGIMHLGTISAESRKGMARFYEAGPGSGASAKVLFSGAGFSLVHATFKSGYPLMLHSHDSDCLYHIVRGSAMLGTAVLGVGEGFFVPADVPYTYKAGPEGVEVLEFRAVSSFDLSVKIDNPSYWDRIVAQVAGNREAWEADAVADN